MSKVLSKSVHSFCREKRIKTEETIDRHLETVKQFITAVGLYYVIEEAIFKIFRKFMDKASLNPALVEYYVKLITQINDITYFS